MNTLKVVGVLSIAVGLLLIGGVVSLSSLSIIIYPQYFWYQLYPDGVSATSPSLIAAGPLTLSAKLVYYDATAGIEIPDPPYWIAQVKVYRNSDGILLQTVSLPFSGSQGGVDVNGHLCAVAFFENSWTVPTGEGVVYRFDWVIQIKDAAGNSLGTQTKTTYAKTADIEPDGSFKVNSQDVTQISRLVVTSPVLTLEFSPTKNSDKITAVKVEVLKGGAGVAGSPVTLAKQATGIYTGSFTLPSPGTYELKGYIEWSGGSPLRRMSTVASWGEEVDGGFPKWSQLAGALLTVAGVTALFWKKPRPGGK
jgi:hypothetical protein